jgi:hypothetical protein
VDEQFDKPVAKHGFRSKLRLKNPHFSKENGDVRRLPRSAPLSRLAEDHRESGA